MFNYIEKLNLTIFKPCCIKYNGIECSIALKLNP
jgi:hypothetical protein